MWQAAQQPSAAVPCLRVAEEEPGLVLELLIILEFLIALFASLVRDILARIWR